MRAATLTGRQTIELAETPDPYPDRGQVVVRVTQCGVCGGDVDLWRGLSPQHLPNPIGHEIAGIVEEVGLGVDETLGEGDHVVVWTHDGRGFADLVLVEARHCIKVDPALLYPAAAEPLACVVNAVEKAGQRLADDVVIVGGTGFMGSLLLMAAKLKGPRTITVTGRHAGGLERALGLGATHVVNTATESLADVVNGITGGRGADVTYESTGAEDALVLAGEVTRQEGKLVIYGYHQGDPRHIPLGQWNEWALDIKNAHVRKPRKIMRGMATAVRLMEAGMLDPSPLMTDVFPLADIAEAFEVAVARPSGFVKAVVTPSAG